MLITLRSFITNRYIVLCLLCGLFGLGAYGVSGMRKIGSLTARANNPALTQQSTPAPVKVITITVTSRGFDPSEIEVPEGRYLISINNRSEIPDLDLRFGALNARKLKESKRLKDKDGHELKSLDWRGLFNLDKGIYKITESSHPDWSVEIRVEKD